MRVYEFNYRGVPLVTKYVVSEVMRAAHLGYAFTSFDLGRSFVKVEVRNNALVLGGYEYDLSMLSKYVDDETSVYGLINGKVIKIAFYADGKYYKLRLVNPYTAPTLEINGVHMHRIKGITPWEDAKQKVKKATVRKGMKVLDIGTGLGYTAIHSLRYGASEVITVEKDINVLKIAELNPWSKDLENPSIKIILGNAFDVIKKFNDEEFDRIIHDPPRIHLAGELYSFEFYKELYRVLKKNGILYHYTGAPGIVHGHDVAHGISKRLIAAGFQVFKYEELLGLICKKY